MENQKYIIPNLKNACRAIKLLSECQSPKTASEVAEKLSIPRTTALRILTTLTAESFTTRTGKKYSPGYMLINIGGKALDKIDLREISRSTLTKLAQETRETAHIAIPADLKTLLLEVVDSPEPVSAASRPGTLAEMHCSATGKCFLAWNHFDKIEEFVIAESPQRRTANSLITVEEIKTELEIVRKQGYAMDNEEYTRGIRCLAAPITSSEGKVIASIGITAGIITFPPESEKMIARKVLSAAATISRMMGGSPLNTGF